MAHTRRWLIWRVPAQEAIPAALECANGLPDCGAAAADLAAAIGRRGVVLYVTAGGVGGAAAAATAAAAAQALCRSAELIGLASGEVDDGGDGVLGRAVDAVATALTDTAATIVAAAPIGGVVGKRAAARPDAAPSASHELGPTATRART